MEDIFELKANERGVAERENKSLLAVAQCGLGNNQVQRETMSRRLGRTIMEPYRQMSRTTRARELTIMMMFLQTERNVNEPFEPLDLWQAGATAGA